MNAILEKCIESRNGNYCHVLEVNDVYEIESAIEAISGEHQDKSIEEVKEFFNAMQFIALNEENEEEIYSFNTDQFIDQLNFEDSLKESHELKGYKVK